MSLTRTPSTGPSDPDAVPGGPLGRPRRPASVMAAVVLLAVVVLGILAYVAIELEDAVRLSQDVAEAEARVPDLPDSGPGLYWTFTYAFITLLVAGAAVLAVLTLLSWLGYGWARVLTVLAALGSAAGGAFFVGGTALIVSEDRGGHGIDSSSFGAALSSLHTMSRPGWVLPVLGVDAVVLPLAAVAALVCLVLPASHGFYRQARAARRAPVGQVRPR
ncbi:hypothetical protein DKT69_08680 [Micromonospora sicca]|uniref:Uncharacterized protein n=1 Tax=Micromonospora sicca TaxID=2202420 RepID=A0A317DM69_9ACTN|nr:hypothetical protein [Micromonospora sp. 4G51]PWR15889.1 hypothetical protein DKT69_08680 [Micromonospora sp. 4G51]